jgi:hypothetical protein
MFSGGDQFEIIVKGDYFIDCGKGYVEHFCDLKGCLPGHISIEIVHLMKYHDKVAFFVRQASTIADKSNSASFVFHKKAPVGVCLKNVKIR